MWFLINRTVSVKTQPNCSTTEQPRTLPLPASKLLWEARSLADWTDEIQADVPSICSFGDLIDSRQKNDEVFHARRLNAWNARTDKLGSLLSIAASTM